MIGTRGISFKDRFFTTLHYKLVDSLGQYRGFFKIRTNIDRSDLAGQTLIRSCAAVILEYFSNRYNLRS